MMNLVYVIDSLALKGGAERIVSEKMNYLADTGNYQVSVITCYQYDNMTNTYPLSSKVRQYNLGIKYYRQYHHNILKQVWLRRKYNQQLQEKLNETVATLQPDIIIGMGYNLADYVCKINTDVPIVIEAHEARPYTMSDLSLGFTSKRKKAYQKILRFFYLRTIEKRANVVVTLTEGDAKEWRKAKRVEIIPNFSTMTVERLSDGTAKRAIAAGRLEWQKGYDRMITIWQQATKEHPDWQLDIFGEGGLESKLRELIQQKNITNIKIHPFTQNISQEYTNSSLCLLTSHYEGFALVLLEAMMHGVPCVTFDCPYGPGEVVDNELCGYVVENDDIQQFADKVEYLMSHLEIRTKFAKGAVQKAATYDKTVMMERWKELFASLKKKSS